MRFLPTMSASRPTLSNKTLRPNRKASTTHCTVAKLALNSAASVGKATLTMVPSTAPMNNVRLTATMIHHLLR